MDDNRAQSSSSKETFYKSFKRGQIYEGAILPIYADYCDEEDLKGYAKLIEHRPGVLEQGFNKNEPVYIRYEVGVKIDEEYTLELIDNKWVVKCKHNYVKKFNRSDKLLAEICLSKYKKTQEKKKLGPRIYNWAWQRWVVEYVDPFEYPEFYTTHKERFNASFMKGFTSCERIAFFHSTGIAYEAAYVRSSEPSPIDFDLLSDENDLF